MPDFFLTSQQVHDLNARLRTLAGPVEPEAAAPTYVSVHHSHLQEGDRFVVINRHDTTRVVQMRISHVEHLHRSRSYIEVRRADNGRTIDLCEYLLPTRMAQSGCYGANVSGLVLIDTSDRAVHA